MGRTSRQFVVIHEPNRNNPAMLALGLVNPEERQLLQFTRSFLQALAERAGLHVLACETFGFITPNRMPRGMATRLGRMNDPHPLAAFTTLVARRVW